MKKTYDKRAQDEVERAVHDYKHHGKYISRDQAVAVGLSKAKRKGFKVPNK